MVLGRLPKLGLWKNRALKPSEVTFYQRIASFLKEASGGVEPPHRGFAIHCLSHLATTPFEMLFLMPRLATVKAGSKACIECEECGT